MATARDCRTTKLRFKLVSDVSGYLDLENLNYKLGTFDRSSSEYEESRYLDQ